MFKRTVALTILYVVLLSDLTFAGSVQLPQTGQTTCYDTGHVIACADTGQDGDLRAGAALPTPRFTDNGNQTITDNLTGLVWTRNADDPRPAACASCADFQLVWQAATTYIKCLNANNFLGFNDWRIPNIRELESLVDLEAADNVAWLDSMGFLGVKELYISSTNLYGGGQVWTLGARTGATTGVEQILAWADGEYNGLAFRVWPVRGGQ